MDRRVNRTKNVIWQSFNKLILDKGYDNVSIKDIIDEANIGRSTFYSHYENKESLLFTGQMHLFSEMFIDDKSLGFGQMLKHAQENSELSKSIFSSLGKSRIIEHMQGFVSQKICAMLDVEFDENDLKKVYLLNSATYSVSSLVLDWIKDDTNLPIKDIEAIIEKNIKIISID